MATVRSPSSFAARKMRMAISLRLAASSFWIGLVLFMTVAKMCCAKFYIVSRTRRDADAVFSMNGKGYLHKLSGESLGDSGQSSYGVAVAAPCEESTPAGTAGDFNCCSWIWTFAQALAWRFVA